MQLTSILLYESLKEQFHIADYRLLSKKQPLARPFFYEADRGLQSSHIYLTEETLDLSVFSSMPEDVVLVICQKSKTSYLPKGRFSCILLSCDTSVIHVFNCIQSIFDYYERWEQQLISVCHRDGSLEELLQLSLPVFKNPLCIIGSDFSLTAQAGLRDIADSHLFFEDTSVRIDYINAFNQDPSCQIPPDRKSPMLFPAYLTGYRSLNMNLYLNGTAQYRLCLIENKSSISEADYYLLTILAQQAEYIIRRMFSESSSRSTTLQSIFQSILSDRTADYMNISHLLESVGWLPQHSYYCCVIQPLGISHASLNADTVCAYMETEFPAACSVVYKELVVTFFNLTLLEAEPEEISQKLVYFIRDSMLKAGYSRAMKGHMNLRRQYHQAYTALSLGSQIKPQLWIHHFNQVAVPYIFRQATRILPGHMLCYEHLLDLIRMDEEQHTEYLKTLRVYLEHNLNTVQSAKALFIHRSTFLYRMEKIRTILETDLEDPDQLFYLNLSLRLLDLEENPLSTE
ncbi:MAG TPA: helix-turn-helix domain-containing protein [Candidatus Blautia pullicola]|uniref:Helix-turn-helix domain-containing protein n=1 Tax=Candidatus Blautia pullicola TaxID=2838498 RepID=A0A9D2FPI8_9FIRM|nr:helix-turn-helix domain-containing protein [Candidatus Blautia pullicola]